MYLDVLQDSTLYEFLLRVDRDLAEQTRCSGCRYCGAALHSACYARRPRGVPPGIDPGPEFGVCFSFCCSAEGCRRRHRAPSVRFLGRRVYLAVMVMLLTAMRQGSTPRTIRELGRRFGADRRTLARWRRWWAEIFPCMRLWQRERSRFVPVVAEPTLPRSMLDRFLGGSLLDRVLAMLRFLSSACIAL
jgi:hypothetical protein